MTIVFVNIFYGQLLSEMFKVITKGESNTLLSVINHRL